MIQGTQTVLTRHRFDVDEYHGLLRAGILDEDHRLELLDGEIVELHGIGSRHFACVLGLHRALAAALDAQIVVSVQGPVRLDRYSEPEPDLAILRPRDDLYASALPGPADTFLIIEVADASLLKDRRVKLPLYAAAGIPEVWIVDLTCDALELYREPHTDGYAKSFRLTEGHVTPLAFPDARLDIRTLVPATA